MAHVIWICRTKKIHFEEIQAVKLNNDYGEDQNKQPSVPKPYDNGTGPYGYSRGNTRIDDGTGPSDYSRENTSIDDGTGPYDCPRGNTSIDDGTGPSDYSRGNTSIDDGTGPSDYSRENTSIDDGTGPSDYSRENTSIDDGTGPSDYLIGNTIIYDGTGPSDYSRENTRIDDGTGPGDYSRENTRIDDGTGPGDYSGGNTSIDDGAGACDYSRRNTGIDIGTGPCDYSGGNTNIDNGTHGGCQKTRGDGSIDEDSEMPPQNGLPKIPRYPYGMIDLRGVKDENKYAKCTVYDKNRIYPQLGMYKEGIHYTVQDSIGQGRFGTVVLTEDVQLKKQSARKSIIKTKYSKEEEEAMLDLADSNISPKLFAVVKTPTKYHLFMEVCSGVTLEKYICTIKEDRFCARPMKTFCGILKGVLEMHGRGWVHKDLHGGRKNILIEEVEGDTRTKIIDFGKSEKFKSDESNYKVRSQDLIDILRYFCHQYLRRSVLGSSRPTYTEWKDNLINFLGRVNQVQLYKLIIEATANKEEKGADAALLNFLKKANVDQQMIDDDYNGIHIGKGTSVFSENVKEQPDPLDRHPLAVNGQNHMDVLERHNMAVPDEDMASVPQVRPNLSPVELADEFQDVKDGAQIRPAHLSAIASMHPSSSIPEIIGQNTTQSCTTTFVPHAPEFPAAAIMPHQLPSPCNLPQPRLPALQEEFTTEPPVSLHAMDYEGMPMEIQLGNSMIE